MDLAFVSSVSLATRKSALREAVVEELVAFVNPKGSVCWAAVEEEFVVVVVLAFGAAMVKRFVLELALLAGGPKLAPFKERFWLFKLLDLLKLDVVARVNVEDALDKLVALPLTAAAADRPDGSWLELLGEFKDGLRGLAPEGVDIDELVDEGVKERSEEDDEELELNEDWREDDVFHLLEVEDSEVDELVEDTLALLSSDEDSVLNVVLLEDDSARR